MKRMLLKLKTLVFLMLMPLSISAATLPEYYPETLPHMQGVVDDISVKTNQIVIDDMQWKFSMNMRVHSLNTEFSSIQALRKSMNVAFKLDTINGNFVIAEIWILPNNYSSNHSE